MGLLKKAIHPHPLLYMRGLKSEDLIGIIDFLYCGEATVFQDNLDTFLALAEELKLKGLTGGAEVKKESDIETPQSKSIIRKKYQLKKQPESNVVSSKGGHESDTTAAVLENKVSIAIQDLDEQVKSLITKGELSAGPGQGFMSSCNVCGKQGPYKNMPNHVETNHITGITHACDKCGKISRSKNALRMHVSNSHDPLRTRTALSQHKSTDHKKIKI